MPNKKRAWVCSFLVVLILGAFLVPLINFPIVRASTTVIDFSAANFTIGNSGGITNTGSLDSGFGNPGPAGLKPGGSNNLVFYGDFGSTYHVTQACWDIRKGGSDGLVLYVRIRVYEADETPHAVTQTGGNDYDAYPYNSGGFHNYCYNGDWSNITHWDAYLSSDNPDSWVDNLTFTYDSGSTPTNTPTITSTHTPTPTNTPFGSGDPFANAYCIFPTSDKADFTDLTGWSLTGTGGHPSSLSHYLDVPPAAQAIKQYSGLDSNKLYEIYLKFSAPSHASDDSFKLKFAQAPENTISVANTSSAQSYIIPAQRYQPSFGSGTSALWSMKVSKDSTGPASGLRIELLCLRAGISAPSGPIANPPVQPENEAAVCSICTYSPVGDLFQDIPKVVQFIGCLLGSLWCQLGRLLTGLWETLLSILGFFGKIVAWFVATIGAAISWVMENGLKVVQFVGGWLSNIVNGVLGFFLNVATLLYQVLSVIVGFLGSLISNIVAFLDVIFAMISLLLAKIGEVLGLVPIIITSIISGLNASPATLPAWAPVCNDSNTFMYWPCIGFYIADNTIWSGPAYYLIPAIMLIIGYNVLSWAIKQIQEAFL